jgi:formylglycine-generating enzyme required for sulfatase activity
VTTLHPRRWDDGRVPRPATAADLEGMTRVDGGSFLMGSEDFYPEEGPVRRVEVEGFWIDERPVTVAEFRRFVKATGHVTVAERPLDPADYDARPGRPARLPQLVDVFARGDLAAARRPGE